MIFYDENGKIPAIILSGTSGTGKNWVVERLESRRFKQIKTHTTRKRRDENDYYHFLTEEEMDEVWGTFCQKFENGGVRYGCSEEDIMDIVRSGKIPILIASPSAAMDMFIGLGESANKYSFFYIHIDAHPDEAFYNLTKERKSSAIEIAQRIYDMDIVIQSSYQAFLDDYSLTFLNDGSGKNEFEVASNSLEALELIVEKYYLGVEEEI